MRFPFLSLACIFLVATAAASQSAKNSTATNPKLEECSVAGRVVKLAGSEPLKSAIVQLQSMDDKRRSPSSVTTDSDGQFVLKGIPPGSYRMRVMRIGFVSQEYGQRTSSSPGANLTLSPAQNMKDLLFRLIPSAIISGRVENEDGEPLPWAHVSALREIYSDGSRTLLSEESVPTNDRGEYRLFGLRPGRYFVAATYRPGARRSGDNEDDEFGGVDSGKENYVRTYYPGNPDATKAETIAVKAGEEISSMDFMMRPAAVFRVRGTVASLIGSDAKRPRNSAMVYLVARKSDVVNRRIVFGEVSSLKQDGTFDLSGVLPGSYTLVVQLFEDNKAHRARQSVEVGNADVEGLQVTIAPGMSISGRVRWDGNAGFGGEDLSVMLRGVDNDFDAYARVEPDGSFTLTDVSDGGRVHVFGEPPDAYLKSVTYAGMDALGEGFSPRAGVAASLDITLSSRGGRVQGMAADGDGLPSVGAWVVLVPDAKHRERGELYKTGRTDQHGQYALRGIAPGDYTLFSWDEVEEGAWQDPEFLKPFEEKTEKVSVQEGDTKSVNLITIKAVGTEEQKP
jgi:hypothetical protein